jgi:hypothetical protein
MTKALYAHMNNKRKKKGKKKKDFWGIIVYGGMVCWLAASIRFSSLNSKDVAQVLSGGTLDSY